MSIELHLHCKATNECVATLRCGSSTVQQLDANVLACFLAYHAQIGLLGSQEFTLRNSSDDDLDRAVVWSKSNYKELLGRAPTAAAQQREFELAASGGLWVIQTDDGRII